MAASNGNKYIVDGSVEIGKVKEMLTSGDMLSSVIPGPQSPACDLGVPFRDVGGKQAQVLPVTPWCLSCPPTACTFAGFLCICFRKRGQGGRWACRANTAATMLPNTPILPTCLFLSPPRLPLSKSHIGSARNPSRNYWCLEQPELANEGFRDWGERWRPGQHQLLCRPGCSADPDPHERVNTDPNSPPRHRFITLGFVNIPIYVCTSCIYDSVTQSCNRTHFARQWLLSDNSKRKQKCSSYTGGCTCTENKTEF